MAGMTHIPLVQTKIVMYCLAMGCILGPAPLPVNAGQSLFALFYHYGSSQSWTWVYRTLKSLAPAKTGQSSTMTPV